MQFYKNPLVSIITVNFNGAKYLKTCIESICNQTYKNIEYLIIDGGSKDNSLNIIKEFDKNITYWHSKPDRGIYDALNMGIKKSKGDIIGILNSDDFLYKHAVETIVNSFKSNISSSYTVGPIDLCDESGNIYKSLKIDSEIKRYENRLLRMPAPHMSVYVLRSVFKEIGFYNIHYKYCSDYDFLLRLMDKQLICAEYINPIGAFRRGGRGGYFNTWVEDYNIRKKFKLGLFFRIFLFIKSFIKTTLFYIYLKFSNLTTVFFKI